MPYLTIFLGAGFIVLLLLLGIKEISMSALSDAVKSAVDAEARLADRVAALSSSNSAKDGQIASLQSSLDAANAELADVPQAVSDLNTLSSNLDSLIP